jgi:3D (Asp-Asp-Asp) domain-containing protein
MIVLLSILLLVVLTVGLMAQLEKEAKEQRARLQAELRELEAENQMLQKRLDELKAQQQNLGRRMQDWLDEWDVDVWESSAYAPLDPRAVRGMCYMGDPMVTASGERVVPGVTAAAGLEVPLGAMVRIRGVGFRKITDRGSRIGNRNIDIAVRTQEEALEWGRRSVKVVLKK